MIALVAFVVGAAASGLLWRLMRGEWASAPSLQRTNYRGHALPIAAGVMIVLATLVAAGAYWTVVRWGGLQPSELRRGAPVFATAIVALGFGLLGLLDDLVGSTTTKGFRGHLGALRHGTVTTGSVKLAFGGLVAVLAAPGDGGTGALVSGALLIALAANLANLFDRAPGRVIKVGAVGALVIAVLGAPGWWLTGPMVILGGGVGMLLPDLREQCMLGDTGANVLGAALGLGLATSLGGTGRWVAVAVLFGLNAASEFVSFSRVVDATAPLRWLDRAGTLPERRVG